MNVWVCTHVCVCVCVCVCLRIAISATFSLGACMCYYSSKLFWANGWLVGWLVEEIQVERTGHTYSYNRRLTSTCTCLCCIEWCYTNDLEWLLIIPNHHTFDFLFFHVCSCWRSLNCFSSWNFVPCMSCQISTTVLCWCRWLKQTLWRLAVTVTF